MSTVGHVAHSVDAPRLSDPSFGRAWTAVVAHPGVCDLFVRYGRRARLAGVRGAAVPIVIGAVVGAVGIVLTIVTEIGNAFR